MPGLPVAESSSQHDPLSREPRSGTPLPAGQRARPASGVAGGWTGASLTMPTRSVQQRAGFRAEAFIDKSVSDAGHVGNTIARDFGINGHIEFVDADNKSAAFSVATQVKGPEVGFPVESLTGFRCTCDADRIDYW